MSASTREVRFEVDMGLRRSRCSRCRAEIVFQVHPRTENVMPLDCRTFRRERDEAGRRIVTAESHFAHCPARQRFRRRRRGRGPSTDPRGC